MPRSYIRFEIADLNGKSLSKIVPARHKEDAVYMYSGALAMGAISDVLTFPDEVMAAGCPNWRLVPDWSTLKALPWATPASNPDVQVSRVLCEHVKAYTGELSETPTGAVPRAICKRLLDSLRAFGGRGLELLNSFEYEFTLAKPVAGRPETGTSTEWEPAFGGVDIFATLQADKVAPFFYDVEENMSKVDIDVKTMNCEYGHGQCEITFAPKFGIDGPDDGFTFKTGVKEIAQKRGYRATFMTRPFPINEVCNGGHFNFSLWEKSDEGTDDGIGGFSASGKTNAFSSSDSEDSLSETAHHFLAGILAHAPAIEALAAPTPACYDRHGHWAPTCANWGKEDRMAAVRVKAVKGASPKATYMECRMPSASSCPYLVVAAVVAAGLDGLRRKLELPAPSQTVETGAKPIPTYLEDALEVLEADSYMVEALGHDFVRWFGQMKRAELKWIADRAEGSLDPALLRAIWQAMYMEYI